MDELDRGRRDALMSHANEAPQMPTAPRAAKDAALRLLRRVCRTVAMSRANYRLAYVTDCACAIACGSLGSHAGGAWPVALASLLGGAVVFSFVEYALHRWLFHSNLAIWSELHASHHEEPRQPAALPFWLSAVSAPVFFWMLTPWLDTFAAYFFLCGFFAGYFCYAVVHHLQHSMRIKDIPFRAVRRQWTAHAIHHGRENVNFGVTTSIWDRLLGTYRPAREVSVRGRAR